MIIGGCVAHRVGSFVTEVRLPKNATCDFHRIALKQFEVSTLTRINQRRLSEVPDESFCDISDVSSYQIYVASIHLSC